MKNLILLILMMPTIGFSQGLLVSTSSSSNNLESNSGSYVFKGESIIIDGITLESDITKSINEDINKLIKVFPNPAKDRLTINATFNKVEIFNSTGQWIKSFSNLNNKQIDISNLNIGVYFISIFNGNNYLITSKIYKQ